MRWPGGVRARSDGLAAFPASPAGDDRADDPARAGVRRGLRAADRRSTRRRHRPAAPTARPEPRPPAGHRHRRPRCLQPAAPRRPGLALGRAGRGLDLHRDRRRPRRAGRLLRRLGRFDDHAAGRRRALLPDADHHHHARLGPRTEHLQRDAGDRAARLAADRPAPARRVPLAAGDGSSSSARGRSAAATRA